MRGRFEIEGLMPDFENQEPPLNKGIEDALAMTGYDPQERIYTLHAAVMIASEYLAREAGRNRTREILADTSEFIKTAQPSRPWPK